MKDTNTTMILSSSSRARTDKQKIPRKSWTKKLAGKPLLLNHVVNSQNLKLTVRFGRKPPKGGK
jgi:hypothetical protein